jgi:hypothetical protein
VLPGDQVSVRVKGRAGTQLQLSVNGEPVPLDRVGQRTAAPASGAQAWEYIGVRFATGVNTLELREVDGFGNARGAVSIQVVAPGELARLRIEVADTTFEADGKTTVPVTVHVEDRSGVPVTARTPVTLGTSDGALRGAISIPPSRASIFVENGRAERRWWRRANPATCRCAR